MTVETETMLIKLLERLEAEAKETNRKLEKLIDDVADLKVGQARLEVEVQNVKEDVKGRITNQGYWFLTLLTALVAFIGKLVFFPNP